MIFCLTLSVASSPSLLLLVSPLTPSCPSVCDLFPAYPFLLTLRLKCICTPLALPISPICNCQFHLSPLSTHKLIIKPPIPLSPPSSFYPFFLPITLVPLSVRPTRSFVSPPMSPQVQTPYYNHSLLSFTTALFIMHPLPLSQVVCPSLMFSQLVSLAPLLFPSTTPALCSSVTLFLKYILQSLSITPVPRCFSTVLSSLLECVYLSQLSSHAPHFH
jgi:hypothetical protein